MGGDERLARTLAARVTTITVIACALIPTLRSPAFAQHSRAPVAAATDAPLVASRISIAAIVACQIGERSDLRSARARVSATDRRWLRRLRVELERAISRRAVADLDRSVRAEGNAMDVSGSYRAAFRWDGARWQISARFAQDAQLADVQSTLLATVLGALTERAAPAPGSEVQVAVQLTGLPPLRCGLLPEQSAVD